MRLPAAHAVDFYKVGHKPMFTKGTTEMFSNFTCRSDRWAKMLPDFDHKVVVPGLQGIVQWLLIDHWNRTFFQLPEQEAVGEYKRRVERGLGIKDADVEHIRALHQLGYLPVRIKELPPGSRAPIRVPLFTIVNTRPEFFWLTNFLETQLSAEYWKLVTTATVAYEYRRLFKAFALRTGTHADFTRWQGHDFSMRGMSGIHDATQCGAGHLMSFCGTDTVSSLDYCEEYYLARNLNIGGSVNATEHSVMCLDPEEEELQTYLRLLTETCPTGIVSIVSDTRDFWRVVTDYMLALKPTIMARQGKLVIRPDSGNPEAILCGTAKHCRTMPTWRDLDAIMSEGFDSVEVDGKYFQFIPDENDKTCQIGHVPYPTPAMKGAVRCLYEVFGGTKTATGHILLDEHIGLIYGDSITLPIANRILTRLEEMGFASGNVVFGIGSFTYQHSTRDTFGTAIKATSAVVNGERRAMFKAPKTDSGVKHSARGLLSVQVENGEFVLKQDQTPEQEATGALSVIFEDGKLINPSTFEAVRNRLHAGAF